MINEEATFRWKGYRSTDLSRGSRKKVWRNCDVCGDGMCVAFRSCSDLCLKCERKSRLIQKRKIPTEKLKCIDDDITYAEKWYRSTDLKSGSSMPVWRVCMECGEGRWIPFSSYRDLCRNCAMEKRRKYNYNDLEDVVRNIDEEKTYAEKGYRSSDLSPMSNKHVYRVCGGCGKGTWLPFSMYKDMCLRCACGTDEARIRNSNAQKGKILSDDHKIKIGKTQEGKPLTEETRRIMSAVKQGISIDDWTHYVSYEPYCEKFNNAFKDAVRDRFDRLCFICDMDEEENGQRLSVHHVSYDKECMCNGVECEFVPLCIRCHAMTNGGRELWERFIINTLYYEGYIK